MLRVIVSVTNDLCTDQRVHKTCTMLQNMGITPVLIGRKLPESLSVERQYPTHRMSLVFRRKVWFYAEYQLRLFFLLLFRKADGLVSNDLDTLLPNYLIAKLKRIPLVYDTHEYFCHTPELIHRPKVQRVWLAVERNIFPKLKHVITVNQSIANRYKEEYGVDISVVRNITPFPQDVPMFARKDWEIPENAFVLINQGSGINVDRGMEEMVKALPLLPTNILLLIVGRGDVIPKLKKVIDSNPLIKDRVIFIPPQPYKTLLGITKLANAGLSLDKTTNPNYKFSLPNKLFDYIHSGLPVIGSEVVEVASIIRKYNIGEIIKSHEPQDIVNAIITVYEQGATSYEKALMEASNDAQWKKEADVLRAALTPLIIK